MCRRYQLWLEGMPYKDYESQEAAVTMAWEHIKHWQNVLVEGYEVRKDGSLFCFLRRMSLGENVYRDTAAMCKHLSIK